MDRLIQLQHSNLQTSLRLLGLWRWAARTQPTLKAASENALLDTRALLSALWHALLGNCTDGISLRTCFLTLPAKIYPFISPSALQPASHHNEANGFKLKEDNFRLAIKKKFFTLRVVRPWPRLPREAVAAPSLAVFKAGLDGA